MSSIDSLYLTYLLTGIAVGFGHCIGMCGPLVISFSLHAQKRSFYPPQLLYHLGRMLTYGILGALMGATGSFTMVAGRISVFQKGAMFSAGGVIVAMGLAMGGWLPRIRIFQMDYSPAGLFSRLFKKLSHAPSVIMYLPLGMVLGLLPCGPVYTALVGTARAGMESPGISQSATAGMVLMMAFGLGNVPALFLTAKLADMGWLKYRDKIYKAGAILMIGMGIYFIISAIRY